MTKLLAVSDEELPYIYKAVINKEFNQFDFIISCGDLPYSYLEYLISMTNKDLYYVRGNHAYRREEDQGNRKNQPKGGIDLHRKNKQTDQGLLLAGIEGSLTYNHGPFQYSQFEMWWMVLLLVPKLILNFIIHGRFLDILVTHAPPSMIHDLPDRPHQGIKAFRWLIKVFQPEYHLHGHSKDYLKLQLLRTNVGKTKVMNVTGYKLIEFQKGESN